VRVLIDATYAHRAPHSGTAVYTERIAAALGALPETEVISAANHGRRQPAGGGVASVVNALADLRFVERGLPRRARAARADLIHHPLPAFAHRTVIPQVITVHDLAFERHPEHFAPAYRRYAHLAHAHAARRADAVICVSHATAAAVTELWGVSKDRIVVAHHGPGQELTPIPRAAEATHLLYIGDDEPRKDLDTLLTAHRTYAEHAAQPLPLIIAGAAHRHQPHTLVERDPTASRLAALLAGAAALVHPAVEEGFGLTVLEAMRAGTPVIAARSAAIAEIGGEAIRYVPPREPDAMARAIAELTADHDLQARLSTLGFAQSQVFSWNLAARAHREAYAVALAR
jgi:glycosyltransferase involved in cell wall biosynthesis